MKAKRSTTYINVFILLTICIGVASGQTKLADLVRSSNNYYEIVAAGEAYFKSKHPGVQIRSLSSGDNRDSEYVKFMRWQSFWKHSLNEDGTLGDISEFHRKQADQGQFRSAQSPYLSVPWTNISYEDYIVSQIGLGRTTSIAFHPTNPDIFYVAAAIGGVWKTTDGGGTYEPLGDELPFMAVSSIVVDKESPTTIYIAVSDHVWYGPPSIGIYKSINGGQTWQRTALTFDLDENIRIYWIEADPNNSAIMFVATEAGLYKTTNRFISVSKVNNKSTFDVKINTGNSNHVYQGGFDGTFSKSVNGGNTFAVVTDFGSSPVYIATTPLDNNRVFARSGINLHRSYDGGGNFSAAVVMPESNLVMAFSPSDMNKLMLGNFDCYRTDNGGSSFYAISQWKGLNDLPSIHVDQRNMFTNPMETDAVYYCNDGGVYRYKISTNTFENLSDGLMITQFYDIAVSQSNDQVIGGGSQDNGNVFRDSLGAWSEYAPIGDGMNQAIDPTNSDIRYWAYQNGTINRWDSGINTNISPPNQAGTGDWETPYRLDPTNPSRILAGYSRVYESLDKGNSWSDISGYIGGLAKELAIAKSNPNRIYVAIGNSLWVRSTIDNSWTARNLPSSLVSDLEVDPLNMDLLYVTISGFSGGKKVFKSADAGMSWTNISGTLPNVSTGAIEIYENMPGGLFVGTDAGVYYKDNTLPDWQQYGNLPHTRVEDIEIQYSSLLIRIGTHGRGVLEAPITIDSCPLGAADYDNDGVCDLNDPCNNIDNDLIGTSCDDGDPTTSGEYFTTDCECGGGIPNAVYCAASSQAGTGSDWIKRVAINTLNSETQFDDYGNYKELSTTLAAGSSYDLTVELMESFDLDKVYAWIDFDRNGVFENTELISMSALDIGNISTGLVNVPLDVGLSPTVMRVRSIYGDPNTADPCGDYYGEVEDYTIRFTHCESSGFLGTGSDWINNVQLGSINHTSYQTFYSDFTSISTNLSRGNSYPVNVSLNYVFDPDTVLLWIDYDQNGSFESSEQTIMSEFSLGGGGTSAGVVTVPDNALPGKTKMRVRSIYGKPASIDPCGPQYAGEVEDYEINITYCAAMGLVATTSDYISKVSLNTIDQLSGKTAYSDFTHVSTDLARGNSYPIEVTLAYAFDLDSVYAWIDFNRNYLFESSEQIIMSELAIGFNSTALGLVQVPEDAVEGNTIMRIRSIYESSNIANPCEDKFGEVEDYTINLTYCAGSGASGTGSDWISKVEFNSINNQSIQTSYSNFKDYSTILYRDNSYELKVTINNAFDPDEVYTWIDFNQDGVFSAKERLNLSAVGIGSSEVSSTVFTIPKDVLLGKTVMRSRVIYEVPNPADPCDSYFGEVEDYSIIFADKTAEAECQSDVHLGNELGNLSSGTYSTSDLLYSTSRMAADSVIHLKASNAIYLNPGFDSELGTVFSATIAPCTSSNNE